MINIERRCLVYMTFTISTAFEDFCNSLRFSDDNLKKISDRYHAITKRINSDYWGTSSDSEHSMYVGSYGRDTEIFTSDIDMLVQLPYSTYKKFNEYSFNGQSALLQEVKKVIEKTYSNTKLKADGQIISISFSDGINFEVLPAFINENGTSYIFANSNNGGSWKITNPQAEIMAIRLMDSQCNSNLKRLCRMSRAWKDHNNVDISGVLLDILSYNFISTWKYRDKSYAYYDWMAKDFFKYVSEQSIFQHRWQLMGSDRYITCFGSFQFKAKVSYNKTLEAINNETNSPSVANKKWREIYGNQFPILRC